MAEKIATRESYGSALVELAEKYDFLIVEDSPYRELRYEGEHIPTMYSLSPDHVIHLGSFSKIFAPGFRLGWAIAHPEVLDKIYVCKQSLDLCPPILDQYVAAEFLSSGRLDENLKKSVALYKGKRDLLLSLLEEHMPEGVKWTHPEGGLFSFLTMPEGFEAVKFYDKALDSGVAYVAGEFFHPDGSGKNTMRLNFSFMTPDRIREGIVILAELLKIFDTEARAKEKRAYTSVNWSQAVLRVRFEEGVGEEQLEMEEANEGEKE